MQIIETTSTKLYKQFCQTLKLKYLWPKKLIIVMIPNANICPILGSNISFSTISAKIIKLTTKTTPYTEINLRNSIFKFPLDLKVHILFHMKL